MKGLGLGSHDDDKQRVYQQLQHLCSSYICASKLTSLHLTVQCCQKRLVKVVKYMEFLEELDLCITYPSSLGNFLLSLAAEPSSKDWPEWVSWIRFADHEPGWTAWCSSQTWHTNILPSLKSLSIQSIKSLSTPKCLDSLLILRLVAWTRSQSSAPLEHLKVWESRGATNDIVTDYISTGYLDRHFGISSEGYDSVIVRAMVTQFLVTRDSAFCNKFHSTVLFKRLQVLRISVLRDGSHILPYLDQIEELEITNIRSPTYSLDVDLPLVCTLRVLCLNFSTFSWMLGRLFKVLKKIIFNYLSDTNEDLVRFKGMQVNVPACEELYCLHRSLDCFLFFSCPNLQTFRWNLLRYEHVLDQAVLTLHDFLLNCPHLQNLSLSISRSSAPDALIHFVFCDAWEQKVWQGIRSVKVDVLCGDNLVDRDDFVTQMIGYKQDYQKRWDVFTISKRRNEVNLRASMGNE